LTASASVDILLNVQASSGYKKGGAGARVIFDVCYITTSLRGASGRLN
jgi:hypothetical protein